MAKSPRKSTESLSLPLIDLLCGDDGGAGRRLAQSLEGSQASRMEQARARLSLVILLMVALGVAAAGRLASLSLRSPHPEPPLTMLDVLKKGFRSNIVDRHGVVLAMNLPTVSVYIDAKSFRRSLEDSHRTAQAVAKILPDLSANAVAGLLKSDRSFVPLGHNLSPQQEYALNHLGVPGLHFIRNYRRVYPFESITAHVVGAVNAQSHGVLGLERAEDIWLNEGQKPLSTTLDVRVQYILHHALKEALETFSAKAAAGVVMTPQGEVLALVSLPDFNPNDSRRWTNEKLINHATYSVYEMGSVFKLFTASAALDSGTADLTSLFDVNRPLQAAGFTIRDFESAPTAPQLTLVDALVHSSNIAAAQIGLAMGQKQLQTYLNRYHLLNALEGFDLSGEIAAPLVPKNWQPIHTMTVSYGHGIAVTPLHVAAALGALVNGGQYFLPRLLKDSPSVTTYRVISSETSDKMRQIMRQVVNRGTAKAARVMGYDVGAKTGTANKPSAGGYSHTERVSDFATAFPIRHPQYIIYLLLDSPKGTKTTFGFATAGFVAAPAARQIIEQLGALGGLPPFYTFEHPELPPLSPVMAGTYQPPAPTAAADAAGRIFEVSEEKKAVSSFAP